MRLYQIVICFFVFFFAGLFYAQNALSYPMVYDDLHLIRSFTQEEIVGSFFGPFDVDNIETAGLRPLTLLFNHVRYELFGENVVAQRLLLIALFAIFGTTIAVITSMLQTISWLWALIAGILIIGAKYNVIHYIWLADGIHLVQGVLFGFSLLMLLYALKTKRFWLYSGSLILTGLNLLVREDTFATIPAFVFLGGYFVKVYEPQSKKRFFIYCSMLASLCIGFIVYRALVLPEGQGIGNPFGVFEHVMYMFALPGFAYFNKISMIFIILWDGIVIGLLVLYISKAKTSIGWKSGVWLICGLAACLSGISVVRVNLLLFPITFFTIFLCSVLQSLLIESSYTKAISIGMVVLALSAELYITPIVTQNFHPYSATAMMWNIEFLYGKSSQNAIIPLQRREEIAQQLSNVGINSYDDYVWFKRKIRSAEEKGQRVPAGENLFVPYLGVLVP